MKITQENVEKILNDLVLSKSNEDVKNIFIKYNISRKDKNKYPDINFNISAEEISKLIKDSKITSDYKINTLLSNNDDLTTLEKLFYSMLWKQGDLIKIHNIISGICGEKTNSIVFNQFGKHLANKNEPIIDQHVLRAYVFYKDKTIIKEIKEEHKKKYSEDYILWIKNNFSSIELNIIDELLFIIGKEIKKIK